MNFCDKCGNELKEDAKFCGSCGKAVGMERNIDFPSQREDRSNNYSYQEPSYKFEASNNLYVPVYYQKEFSKIQASREAYKGKFNWAAFIFGAFWALSKGLWLSALVAIIASIATGGVLGFVFWFIFGFRGNYIYYNKIVKDKQTIF